MAFPSCPGPFVQADASPWNAFLHLGIKRSFKENSVILHPEQNSGFLYYLQQGEMLTTFFTSPDNSLKVNIIGENAIVGIFEMFAPFPVRASWRTLRPCVCYLFSRECIENDLPKPLLTNLLEQCAFMGVSMTGRLARSMNGGNDVRIARFLLHIAEICPLKKSEKKHGITLLPSITQEMSSELLGIHPVTFNRILTDFRGRGILGKSRKSGLEILDINALARYAENKNSLG